MRVTMNEVASESIEDVFSGWDSLRCLTYSTSLSFIARILPLIPKVTMIIGSSDMVRGELSRVISAQGGADLASRLGAEAAAVSAVRELGERHGAVADRVLDGSLRIHAHVGFMSHQKLFILERSEGGEVARRLLIGSANASVAAFSGRHAEMPVDLFPDDRAVAFCETRWTRAVERAPVLQSDVIVRPPEKAQEDQSSLIGPLLDHLPTIRAASLPENHGIVRVSRSAQTDTDKEDAQISEKAEKTAVELIETIPPEYRRPKFRGGATVSVPATDLTRSMKSAARRDVIHKEVDAKWHASRVEDDGLRVLDRDGVFSAAGDLDDAVDALAAKEAAVFLDYLSHTESAYSKGGEDLALSGWVLLCWMMASPFLARARLLDASVNGDQRLDRLPLHACLYGVAGSGKTSLIEAAQRAVFGRSWKVDKSGGRGGRRLNTALLEAFRLEIGVFPLFVDEYPSGSLSRTDAGYTAFVKNENVTPTERSPMVITTNGRALLPEAARRVLALPIVGRKSKSVDTAPLEATRALTGALMKSWHAHHGKEVLASVDAFAESRDPDLLLTVSGTLAEHVDRLFTRFDLRAAAPAFVRGYDRFEISALAVKPFLDCLRHFASFNPDWVTFMREDGRGGAPDTLIVQPPKGRGAIETLADLGENAPSSVLKSKPTRDQVILDVNLMRKEAGISVYETFDRRGLFGKRVRRVHIKTSTV